MNNFIAVVNAAAQFLREHPGSPKILCKVSKNLGDSIHAMPIIKHYRMVHPNAAIAFITSQLYHGVHETNLDISKGGLFILPNGITEQQRLKLWPVIYGQPGIDIRIIPAINPFSHEHPENTWSFPCIADQYFANARIPDRQPIGGRRYIIRTTQDDKRWAGKFLEKHGIDPAKGIVIEYNSYSHPVAWLANVWAQFIKMLPGYRFIGVAAGHEGMIDGMVDARGISWRQTVALLERVPKMIGVGSGLTMLAAGADPQPKIYELAVPESVTMKACGYADSEVILSPTPELVKQRMGL